MTRREIRSCEDAIRLLAAHLDGELHDGARADMERHLDTCRSCYSRAEFEARLKALLVGAGPEPARPELRARARTLIRDFTPVAPDAT